MRLYQSGNKDRPVCGTGEGSRSEVRGYLNVEPWTSNFGSRRSRLSRVSRLSRPAILPGPCGWPAV